MNRALKAYRAQLEGDIRRSKRKMEMVDKEFFDAFRVLDADILMVARQVNMDTTDVTRRVRSLYKDATKLFGEIYALVDQVEDDYKDLYK